MLIFGASPDAAETRQASEDDQFNDVFLLSEDNLPTVNNECDADVAVVAMEQLIDRLTKDSEAEVQKEKKDWAMIG